VRSLGLDDRKEKVGRYYRELEAGLLEPERVDRRVWVVLAEALGARVSDLFGWRARLPDLPAPAFPRSAGPVMAAMRILDRSDEVEDEVDRLFRSG
jgi:hypothetical protein